MSPPASPRARLARTADQRREDLLDVLEELERRAQAALDPRQLWRRQWPLLLLLTGTGAGLYAASAALRRRRLRRLGARGRVRRWLDSKRRPKVTALARAAPVALALARELLAYRLAP